MLLDYSYPIERSPPYEKKKYLALLAAFALPLEAFFAFFQLHLECRPFLFSLPYYDQMIP